MSSEPLESRERPVKTGHRAGRSLLLLIIGGLMLWGGYVACGMLLYSTDESLTEGTPRGTTKAVIVVSCVLAFLALWAVVLLRPEAAKAPHRTVPGGHGGLAVSALSWFGLASLVVQLVAFGPWLAWHLAGPLSAGQLRAFFGGSLLTTGIALVLAIIGLSDPVARRGKLSGLVTILLTVVLVGSWLWLGPE